MLCIETDEFAHRSYKKDDEDHWYSDLFMANSCKYIFIRFNPDSNREARRAKTDFDAKLRVLMPFMRAQIKRIEDGENTELVEIHKLFCCKNCLENGSSLCVCDAEEWSLLIKNRNRREYIRSFASHAPLSCSLYLSMARSHARNRMSMGFLVSLSSYISWNNLDISVLQ